MYCRRSGSSEYDTYHDSEHYSEISTQSPSCPSSNAEFNPQSDPELQLQYGYRPNLMRLISCGATIFKEGDASARITTTPTANYLTGSAGTKHRATHCPIEKAASRKSTWRRSNNCTPRTAKRASKEAMANAATDESRSRMRHLNTWIRFWLSLGDPDSVLTIPRHSAATGNLL